MTNKSSTKTASNKGVSRLRIILPVIMTFFVAGLVAMIGAVTSYVKRDFGLSSTTSSLLASAIYIWFLVMAIPTGYIMNHLGHRKTVILALTLSCISMLFPILYYSYWSMVFSFCLLGIANTMLQISLNLLVSDVTPKRQMSSMLTLGQFVGQIPAMIIPALAIWSAHLFGNWYWVYPFFLLISIGLICLLYHTNIKESADKDPSSIKDLLSLFDNKAVLFCFIGIVLQVGLDVGLSITTPEVLIERTAMTSESASIVTSVYFVVRLLGCLGGSYVLANFSNRRIYIASISLILLGCIGLLFTNSRILIYICTALAGLGVSNLFAILFSQALETAPRKKNDISALMIMGLVGGAILPPILGAMTSLVGGHQFGAVLVLMLCAGGMLYISVVIKDE